MSLRDRPGPGVQGFPILFIATAESIYVQRTPPEPGQGPLWEPWCPSTISWKDWGKEAWEQAGGWVPSPPSPHPRYPIAQEDLKLMLPWGSLC